MAEYLIQGESLTAIADAIRSKTNDTDSLSLSEMPDAISNIETGGVELPALSNEGSASELFSGKELIDGDGNIVTGTFTIDNELSAQDDLISQIQTALSNKATGIVLPELANPGTAENLEEGYELIDGEGNIVVGTHVCSGGDGGNIMYFNVINNLPDILFVNGKVCPQGESIAIPYDEMDYSMTLFGMTYQSEEYSISAPYTQIYEDDDGEMIEEVMEGAPIYSLNEDFGFITGFLADFQPDPYGVLNNTITFEAIY